MKILSRLVYGLPLFALALMPMPACAEPPKLPVPAVDQSAVGQRGYFYVGGKYIGEPGKEIMQSQAYVEVVAPKDQRRPYPLVLIHGAGQTATNWMGTPDGRQGWAEYFAEQGYVVYMIKQPMRGRSAWHPGDGVTRMFTAQGEQLVLLSIASPLTRPSPNGRRVGIRIVTFEACSGFTHVTARRIAQPPTATFVTRLQPMRLPA